MWFVWVVITLIIVYVSVSAVCGWYHAAITHKDLYKQLSETSRKKYNRQFAFHLCVIIVWIVLCLSVDSINKYSGVIFVVGIIASVIMAIFGHNQSDNMRLLLLLNLELEVELEDLEKELDEFENGILARKRGETLLEGLTVEYEECDDDDDDDDDEDEEVKEKVVTHQCHNRLGDKYSFDNSLVRLDFDEGEELRFRSMFKSSFGKVIYIEDKVLNDCQASIYTFDVPCAQSYITGFMYMIEVMSIKPRYFASEYSSNSTYFLCEWEFDKCTCSKHINHGCIVENIGELLCHRKRFISRVEAILVNS